MADDLKSRGGEINVAELAMQLGSPVALALLKARQGDEVRVRTPRGFDLLEVLEIAYPEP